MYTSEVSYAQFSIADVLRVNKVRNGVIIQSQMYLWLQTDLKQVNLEQTETIDREGRSGRVWGTTGHAPAPDKIETRGCGYKIV